jgi:hypothetical protein
MCEGPWNRSKDYHHFVQRLIGKRNDSHIKKTADLLIGGYVEGQSELNAMKCVCPARSDLIKTFTRWRIRHRPIFSKPNCQRLWNSTPLSNVCRLRLKCDGTRAETRFCLSVKRTSPFKSTEGSVQSTTGRRAVHISLQGLYCSCKPVFCSHVTLTGYPLHSPVFPSLLLPCVTVCHHISHAVC